MSSRSTATCLALCFAAVACASSTPPAEDASASPACAFPERAAKPASTERAAKRAEEPAPLPDDARCETTTTPELLQEIESRLQVATLCYERLLSEKPVGPARVVVDIRVEQDGTAASSATSELGLPDPELTHCLSAVFAQPYAARPANECVDVSFPIKLRLARSAPATPVFSRR